MDPELNRGEFRYYVFLSGNFEGKLNYKFFYAPMCVLIYVFQKKRSKKLIGDFYS